jgi:uncharacterized protein (UPF0276 family)
MPRSRYSGRRLSSSRHGWRRMPDSGQRRQRLTTSRAEPARASFRPRVRGVGIGLRTELWRELSKAECDLDWLELIPENYVERGGWRRAQLEHARERWPLVAHGVSVSVGGPDPIERAYLQELKRLLDVIGADFYSDHLCWASGGGYHFHDLLPLAFTAEAVEWTATRARFVSQVLERPLLLENITHYATMPGSVLTEGEFVRAVLEESGAFLLLDVNNAYVNAVNHGRDPLEMLCALPLERTCQIHLAGHEQDEQGVLLDRHGSAIAEPVWDLFRHAIQRVGEVPVLIEWDNDIPPLERVLAEAHRARATVHEELVQVA